MARKSAKKSEGRTRSSQNNTVKKQGSSSQVSHSSRKTSAPLKRHRPSADVSKASSGLLDDNTKKDITGVLFIIVAAVFFLLVVVPSNDAIVSAAFSQWIRLIFGVGAYLFPLVLVGIGISFLQKTQESHMSARTAIGLSILFLALLGFVAVFTPTATLGIDDLQLLFVEQSLISHGGYVGAGLAFALMSLLGRLVSGVIFVGFMVIGIVIVGFSVSKTIEQVKAKKREREERMGDDNTGRFGSRRLRVRKAEDVPFDVSHQAQQRLFDPANPENYDASMTRPLHYQNDPDGALSAQLTRPIASASEVFQPLPNFAQSQDEESQSEDFSAEDFVRLESWSSHGHHEEGQTLAEMQHPMQPVSQSSSNALQQSSQQPPAVYQPHQHPLQHPVKQPMSQGHPSYQPQPYQQQNAYGQARFHQSQPVQPMQAHPKANTIPLEQRVPQLIADNTLLTVGAESVQAFVPHVSASEVATAAVSVAEDCVANAPAAITPEGAGNTTSKKEAGPKKPSRSKKAVAGQTRDGFTLPSMSLLKEPDKAKQKSANNPELQETACTLQQTLENFGINASVVGWVEGPTVTLFSVDLPSGVRVSRITNLNDDIALALASPGVRIFAPIPGTNHVGIEIPNKTRQTVVLSEVLQHAQKEPLELALGKDVEGNAIISDLAKMPHLLIGGTTGSGKSVAINAMIMSILMRCTPSEVRFIMIDPKRVEFTPYNGIPHLYVPVVTEPKEAASALSWGVAEMERRLKVFSKIGVRNIIQYNNKVKGGGIEDGEGRELDPLPYIVIIIDELADLMMNVGKEVEFSISRIAQLARAAGIHLIVATQRPSTNVVTGLIKANITNRIAFNVASGIDSRVILDTPGAENLIGLGDMLLSKPELPKPHRIQACYVSEDEIEAVVEFIKAQAEPEYHDDILKTNVISLGNSDPHGGSGEVHDPLVWEAAEIVVSSKMGSTSNIQRRLKVGYSRAGRIMDQLEELGIVGPANGSKPREVFMDALELETLKAFEAND